MSLDSYCAQFVAWLLASLGNIYKTFYGCNLRMFIIAREFVLGKPFQFTRVGSGLTPKHLTKLVRPVKDKH